VPNPPSANLPKCTRCQSEANPSLERYCIMGASTRRLGSTVSRMVYGEKSLGKEVIVFMSVQEGSRWSHLGSRLIQKVRLFTTVLENGDKCKRYSSCLSSLVLGSLIIKSVISSFHHHPLRDLAITALSK